MEKVIKLEVSARRKKVLLLNDLIPAVILFFTGATSAAAGGFTLLAATNILSGGLLVTFGVREWRSLGRESGGKIQWYDLVSGVVMGIDAASMYKPWKGFQPADLYAILALFLMLKGFGVIRVPEPFRGLTISEAGFGLRTGPFSRSSFTWEDVEGISREGHHLLVRTKTGVSNISLRRISSPREVEEALVTSFEARKNQLTA